jgi:GTP-dependent phosphoenolpyruvate carboxykinase
MMYYILILIIEWLEFLKQSSHYTPTIYTVYYFSRDRRGYNTPESF